MDKVYEVVQLLNGDIYVYRGGWKNSADQKNVFKFTIGRTYQDQYTYAFTRFDFIPCTPSKTSQIRMFQHNIVFSWFLDPDSDIVKNLEKADMEMNASKSGIVLTK